MKISVIGVGVVGSAISKLIKMAGFSVNEVDKRFPDYTEKSLRSQAIQDSEFIFLTLPTPTVEGKQDLEALTDTLRVIDKSNKKTIYILKSTVLPGVTRYLSEHYGINIIHSPEFLSELSAADDFYNQHTHYFGLTCAQDLDVKTRVEDLYNKMYSVCGAKPVLDIKWFSSEETELIKYTANCFYATKVTFFNEIFRLCNCFGASYDKVRDGAISSKDWINPMHTSVPGRHGLGYYGMCFPKDMQALSILSSFIRGVDDYNKKIRGDK